MALFRFTLNIGLYESREDTEEIPDDELAGLDGDAREEVIHNYWREWAANFIDGNQEEIESEEADNGN